MRDLILQEKFELEVLEKLKSKKLLGQLVFSGGTMLRLCYGLKRFSVDLDFWVIKAIQFARLYDTIGKCLRESYTVKDSANKFNTLLFEIRSKAYPRSLKIEIRKEAKQIAIEQAIAYSIYADTQVLLNTVSLADMFEAKVNAFINRKEIRDAFDLEFLIKRGITAKLTEETRNKVINTLNALSKKDYSVKLGSLLPTEERKYYTANNFKILTSKL